MLSLYLNNYGPWSLMMSYGRPWYKNISLITMYGISYCWESSCMEGNVSSYWIDPLQWEWHKNSHCNKIQRDWCPWTNRNWQCCNTQMVDVEESSTTTYITTTNMVLNKLTKTGPQIVSRNELQSLLDSKPTHWVVMKILQYLESRWTIRDIQKSAMKD